ncbi:MAG: CHAT domain-containing protein [Acidobacteriota bacterium]|nr:CHAT domain-containing protein [Acidobacteriota bacterium]
MLTLVLFSFCLSFQEQTRGIVIEEPDRILEEAGLVSGDVLIAWERSPAGAEGKSGGSFETPRDWLLFAVEQAPRGPFILHAEHAGRKKSVLIDGVPKPEVRPRLSPEQLALYKSGKELIDSGDVQAGLSRLEELADRMPEPLARRLSIMTGDHLLQARQWEAARQAYADAMDGAEPDLQCLILVKSGRVYRRQGQLEQARQTMQQAVDISIGIEADSLLAAYCQNALFILLSDQGKLDEALSACRTALAVREKQAPGSLETAESLDHLGDVLIQKGALGEAVTYLERAMEIWRKKAPGSRQIAGTLGALGMAAHYRGVLQDAESYYKRALKIERDFEPRGMGVAALLMNMGVLSGMRGDLKKAEQAFLDSLEIQKQHDTDKAVLANAWTNLGVTAAMRGAWEKAEDYHQSAYDLQQELNPESMGSANCLNNLAQVAHTRGCLEEAHDLYRRASEITHKLAPDSLPAAACLDNLGQVYADMGRLQEARSHYERALAIRERLAPDSLILAVTLGNMGKILGKRGHWSEAEVYFNRALTIQEKLAPNSYNFAVGLGHLGRAAWKRGDPDRARGYFNRALAVWEELAPHGLEMAGVLNQLGLLARELGDLHEAEARLARAVGTLETQIGRLGGSTEVVAGYRARHQKIYDDRMLLLADLSRPSEAFYTLERSRARTFLAMLAERDIVPGSQNRDLIEERQRLARLYEMTQQQLTRAAGQAEMQAMSARLRQVRAQYEEVSTRIRSSSPRLASLIYPEPLNAERAAALLEPGTVLLSYAVTAEETVLFVIRSEQEPRLFRIPKGEDYFRGKVTDLRGHFHKQPGDDAVAAALLQRTSRRLFDDLIEPARAEIETAERLVIVADGSLWTLPFHLLRDRSGRYLVQWKPLSHVVSATVYAELGKMERRGHSQLAAFGNPVYPRCRPASGQIRQPGSALRSVLRVNSLTALPHTEREINAIAAIYGKDARVYLGERADEARAKSLGTEPDLIHFACHAYLNENSPLDSALVLSIPETFSESTENGILQAWEILEEVRLNADLVILSACGSGLGKELGGEGLMGLKRAFQYAGARSVSASLWTVSDAATAELMTRFYTNLKAGDAKDEALRKAQLSFIEEPVLLIDEQGENRRVDVSHPYYWAAFQLNGRWD